MNEERTGKCLLTLHNQHDKDKFMTVIISVNVIHSLHY